LVITVAIIGILAAGLLPLAQMVSLFLGGRRFSPRGDKTSLARRL
jgi:hypothetical protein